MALTFYMQGFLTAGDTLVEWTSATNDQTAADSGNDLVDFRAGSIQAIKVVATPDPFRKILPLAEDKQVDGLSGTLLTNAIHEFLPSDHQWVDGSTTVQLKIVASVSVGTITGTCYLYNITDDEIVTSSTCTIPGTALLPTEISSTITVGSGANEMKLTSTLYEPRLTNSGSIEAELVTLHSASLEIYYP